MLRLMISLSLAIVIAFQACGTKENEAIDANAIVDKSTIIDNAKNGTSGTSAETTNTSGSATTTVTLSSCTATIDGDSSDFAGATSILTDPAGDISSYNGLDFTALSGCYDSLNLYLKVSRSGTTSTGSSAYNNWWITFESTDKSLKYALEIFSSTDVRVWKNDTQLTGVSGDVNSASTDMEISAPIAEIDRSLIYTVSMFSHYQVNGSWDNTGYNTDNSTSAQVSF